MKLAIAFLALALANAEVTRNLKKGDNGKKCKKENKAAKGKFVRSREYLLLHFHRLMSQF
jgi:hypothetical protein